MIVILFAVLLISTFGVMLYFLRPTPTEAAVQQHLDNIEGARVAAPGTENSILRRDAFSSTPWMDDLLRRLPVAVPLARLIRQAGLSWHVSSVLLFSLAAFLLGGFLASYFIPLDWVNLLIGLALAFSPYLYLYILRELRFKRCDALLPEAVDLMARGLRAGHSVPAVLEMVGAEVGEPLASEFRCLHEEQALGLPLRDAMLNLVERVPRDDMRILCTAILLQKETGGNLAYILDKTAALARERARLRGQLKIYTAQGRITGWILSIAPFIMFALISTVNWKYEKILFTEPIGLDCIYGGLVMMVIGILVIRKIIAIDI
jgi:tight adherence protein B